MASLSQWLVYGMIFDLPAELYPIRWVSFFFIVEIQLRQGENTRQQLYINYSCYITICLSCLLFNAFKLLVRASMMMKPQWVCSGSRRIEGAYKISDRATSMNISPSKNAWCQSSPNNGISAVHYVLAWRHGRFWLHICRINITEKR